MMLASIDVGSNTLRLLLGRVADGQVEPICYARRITRLKGGATESGLADAAMQRTIAALSEFSELINQHDPSKVRAVATEALRSAANGREFVDRVRTICGIDLEVISGDEEALLTTRGVCSTLPAVAGDCLIFDIGGGSTEFILVRDGRLNFRKSYRLGVVDLTEKLPSVAERLPLISATIESLVSELPVDCATGAGMTLVGTAGTVTTLAALDLEMTEYDWRRVNGYALSDGTIARLYQRLQTLDVAGREDLPGMEAGRGDLILAGVEIIQVLMRRFAVARLLVSDFGILEGTLLALAETGAPKD